jgi:dUTPase
VGDRVAQLLVMPFCFEMMHEVDRLGETHRGERGFGSTG